MAEELVCPKCNKEIVYHYLGSFNTSKHKNSKCLTCRTSSADYPLNKINREVKLGIRKNGFADKKHTEEQKNKWSVIRKTNSGKYKTSEFRIKMSEVTKGEKNPMYGKTFYDIWLSKYGKEIADEKLKNFRAKQSELNSGEKNNMYGKPSPHGSGSGYSGHYRNFYFRSLLELSFILEMEKSGINLIGGEIDKFAIKYYNWKGMIKTYRPDYVDEVNKIIYEIKPKRLCDSPSVKLKTIAAKKEYPKFGYTYELITPTKISTSELTKLINNKHVILIDRCLKEYQKYISKYE